MEILDTPSWRWGLSPIAFTMAIHATVVVLMAFVGVRVRARLESRLDWYSPFCTEQSVGCGQRLICGLALSTCPQTPCCFPSTDEHARRLRSDAATTLADDGCSGSSRILLFGVSAAYIFAVMQAYWSMLAARGPLPSPTR